MSVMALEKVVYFANFIITDVDEAARETSMEQLKAEYKAKKKMIEGEFTRDVGRLEEKFKGDGAKVSEETEHLAGIRDRKMAELEEEFLIVDRELKDLKQFKIITEATYRDWSLKYGHIFDAAIGAEAVSKMLSRVNLVETMKMIDKELEKASGAKRDRLIRRMKLLKSLNLNGWSLNG